MEPGLAERPVVGLGSNAPEVAFDHQSLVAGQVCAGEAQRAADARRDRERQVTGQRGCSPQRRGGELHLGCVRADVARSAGGRGARCGPASAATQAGRTGGDGSFDDR